MCGILGITQATGDVVPALIEGLHRLEYRGYDSAGVGVHTPDGLKRTRVVGRVAALEERLQTAPLSSQTGVAHTRWATHGGLAEKNAHPQGSSKVLVVHNGIVENAEELRRTYVAEGARFESETDTELLAHAVTQALTEKPIADSLRDPAQDGFEAALATTIRQALTAFEGSFAVLVLWRACPGVVVAFRQGFSPLAVGIEEGAEPHAKPVRCVAGSDAVALAGLASRIAYLESGDMAVLTPSKLWGFQATGPKLLSFTAHPVNVEALTRDGHAHFMHKEIHEQPDIVDRLAAHYLPNGELPAPEVPCTWMDLPLLHLVGCGTAFFAAETSAYVFETLAELPTRAHIASELRYRLPTVGRGALEAARGALVGAVSQSGETADTLAALDHVRKQKAATFAVLNVTESSIARQVDRVFSTYAGPEIAVASTKAFTAQLWVLSYLALQAAQARRTLSTEELATHAHTLQNLATKVRQTLLAESLIQSAARHVAGASSCLFLGRGPLAPVALEGALKMKEITYIHAEGYAAGELKHGPIALLTSGLPVVLLAPSGPRFHKDLGTLQEVRARGASVVVITDKKGQEALQPAPNLSLIAVPETCDLEAPFVMGVVLQLLAYHTALLRGTDVDRPRNLAKSVTVE